MEKLITELLKAKSDLTKKSNLIPTVPAGSNDCPFCGKPLQTRTFCGKQYAFCDCQAYKDAQKTQFEIDRNIANIDCEIERINKAEANKRSRVAALAEAIGDQLSGATFDNFDATGKEAIVSYLRKYVREFPRQELPGIVLTGAYGVGKSHLATAVANELKLNYTVVFCYAGTLLMNFRDALLRDGEHTEKEVFSAVSDCDLLILDDLGRDKKSEWTENIMFQVIDRIYTRKKGLIITTNLTTDSLADYLGGAAWSRVAGMSQIIHMGGIDHRMRNDGR